MPNDNRLTEIKAREELRRSQWWEDFGDSEHRCRHCDSEATTIWEPIEHRLHCPVKAAWEQERADMAWLIDEVEGLTDPDA